MRKSSVLLPYYGGGLYDYSFNQSSEIAEVLVQQRLATFLDFRFHGGSAIRTA